jgi:hypothetical protein
MAQHDGRYCEKLMKNAGIQVDTPEVLLSHHGLLEVCSFERLKCMEALWLNDNLLTKVEGLDTNMQLKALYLHNNRINTLRGSLKFLRHIEMLSLQNNRLTDLEATLKLMQHLTRLEELDMSGNPLANELNYRPRVIHRFPKLKVLDRHVIEWEERRAAKEMFEGKATSNLGFMKRKPLWKNPPTQPVACLSILTKEMYKKIDVYKRETKEEQERRERAAVQGRKVVPNTTAPLARTVEEMNSKTMTLNDVLGKINSEYGTDLCLTTTGAAHADAAQTKRSRSKGATENASSNNRAASVAAHEQLRTKRDFVAMKRYRSPAARVDALSPQDWLATRTFSATAGGGGAGDTWASDVITLDADRFAAYETRQAQNKLKTDLVDWGIEM